MQLTNDKGKLIKLTDRTIPSLPVPPKPQQAEYYGDDPRLPGFGVRVSYGGTRTFILRCRTKHGKTKRLKLGRYGPEGSFAKARKAALQAIAKIDAGEDPQEKKRGPATVEGLFKYYFEQKPTLRTMYERKRLTKEHVLPAFGDAHPDEVDPEDVLDLCEGIEARTVSNRVFELIRAVYNFGRSRRKVTRSPCYGLALLHGPEQIADLPVPVVESPGAVRIGHPERGHLVEYLAPNSVFNSLPRQRSCPHLGPDDRFVTIDRVLHHASLGAA